MEAIIILEAKLIDDSIGSYFYLIEIYFKNNCD